MLYVLLFILFLSSFPQHEFKVGNEYRIVLLKNIPVRSTINSSQNVLPTSISKVTDPSSNNAHTETCDGYTHYLKGITPAVSLPQLVDIIPIFVNSTLIIHIIMNIGNVKNKKLYKHCSFSLLYLNQEYQNLVTKPLPESFYFDPLKFMIPTNRSYSQGEVIYVTIVDHKLNKTYSNIRACVKLPAKKKLPLVTCSYITDYNSLIELRSFLAFQRIQNVSMVIWYMATPVKDITTAFSKVIESGYLKLIDFTWPRVKHINLIIVSNQHAQMNSFFYRFKYEVEAMIICDVDEYVHCEKFPFNLPSTVQWIQSQPENYDSVHVQLFLFLFVRLFRIYLLINISRVPIQILYAKTVFYLSYVSI